MKYEYTKTDITKAEDLVPGEHFIKVGETYCEIGNKAAPYLSHILFRVALATIYERAQFFIDLGCPVYTRQEVEPLVIDVEFIDGDGCRHPYASVSGDFGPHGEQLWGKRFRCTEIMEDEG